MDPQIRHSICATCLSTNRRLLSVKLHQNLISYLIKAEVNPEEDRICWECEGVLNKVLRFTTRAMRAQQLLKCIQQINQQRPTSLSSLINTPRVTYVSTLHEADTENASLCYGQRLSDKDVRRTRTKSTGAPGDVDIIVPKSECVDVGIFESESHGNDSFETTSTRTDCVDPDVLMRDDAGELETEMPNEDLCRSVTGQRVKVKDMKRYKLKTLSHRAMLAAREKEKNLPAYKKNKFNCDLCVSIYKNGEQLEKHNVKHSEQRGCMVCSVCQCRFADLATLQRHRLQHYQIYECYHCDYSNTRMRNMIDHCNRAHRDPGALFKCSRCKEMFGSPGLLRKHRLSVHSGRVPCEKCERNFTNKQSLKRHITLVHNEAPQTYECAECGKRYRSRHGLTSHLYSHSPPAAAAFCAPCNVQYSTVYAYRTHLQTSNRHVAEEDKRYQCKDCGKRFSMKVYLNCHNIAVHLKKADHECSVCNKMFVTVSGMRRHKMCVHDKRPRPKNYICDICAKAYLNKAALVQHMYGHSGARPYRCAHCPANFAYSGALHTHVKLVHLRLRRGDSLAARIACGKAQPQLAVT